MQMTARRTGILGGFLATVAAVTLSASAAFAQVTPPPSVVPIGGATNSTISNVKMNGTTTTLLAVAPGTNIDMQAKLTLGSGVNPGWVYWSGYGWSGNASAAGCSAGVQGSGDTTTTNFSLTASNTAGVYDVVAALGPDPCPWSATTPGPTIAKVVVTSYESVCVLAESYSTDPYVAQGLCDKLVAAETAGARDQMKTEANIQRAFNNQVKAQTGKALTMEQAEMLTTLVSYL
jgi:hypothetical protein